MRGEAAEDGGPPLNNSPGDRAACAGDRHARMAGIAHRSDERCAGVADGGRAGVADIGHALAACESREHALRCLALVVLVQRDERLVDAEMAQQRCAVARVLAGDGVDEGEHMNRAQAQVREVADRRRDHVQRSCGILLRAGRSGSGLQQQRGIRGGGHDQGRLPHFGPEDIWWGRWALHHSSGWASRGSDIGSCLQ